MKKKIIALGIVGMFLLVGLTTVSAVEEKPVVASNNDDLPDLTVEIVWFARDILSYYHIRFVVKNEGLDPIDLNQGLPVCFIAERSGKILYDKTVDLANEREDPLPILSPDEEYETWYDLSDYFPIVLSTIKVVLDPDNTIDEIDDENNDDTVSWPYFTLNQIYRIKFWLEILRSMFPF